MAAKNDGEMAGIHADIPSGSVEGCYPPCGDESGATSLKEPVVSTLVKFSLGILRSRGREGQAASAELGAVVLQDVRLSRGKLGELDGVMVRDLRQLLQYAAKSCDRAAWWLRESCIWANCRPGGAS